MKLITIVKAEYLNDYKIKLSFNNGNNGVVDLKNKIFNDHRKIFKPLRDITYFKSFTQNTWTIEWENGVDLAPEFLYGLAMKSK